MADDEPDTPTRVVLAHGFTQTARSWSTLGSMLATALGGDRREPVDVVAVDLPGHGDAADLRTDLWGAADHLVDRGGPGMYVGYSMGGRVALHAALAHPETVERLVLIGATAGIDDADERDRRRAADERLADRVEQIGVERFVEEWLANPLFAGLDEAAAMPADRGTNTVAGLASSLRLAGTGTQGPLWDRLVSIEVPVLVLVGEFDEKFRRLGERLTDSIPHAALTVVAGAGHSAHLEQPQRTVDAIARWVRP